ncbi:MAG: hypothetical protein LIP02_10500 [Bacteroidales bacterium]|nr:hypothetical protein [Bacteroidales bacterium]
MKKILFTLLGLIVALGAYAGNENEVSGTADGFSEWKYWNEVKDTGAYYPNWSWTYTTAFTSTPSSVTIEYTITKDGDSYLSGTAGPSGSGTANGSAYLDLGILGEGSYVLTSTVTVIDGDTSISFSTGEISWTVVIDTTAKKATLTWGTSSVTKVDDVYYGHLPYEITLENIEESDIASIRVWMDAPGNVNCGEASTISGTLDLTFPSNPETLWIKGLITLKDESTITPVGNDTGVGFTYEEIPVTYWYGTITSTSTNSANQTYEVTAYYWIRRNEDKTLTVYVEDNGSLPGVVRQVFINGCGVVGLTADGDGYSVTTTQTFNTNDQVLIYFYYAWSDGGLWGNAAEDQFTYTVGSSNDPWAKDPVITAEATNVTYNSADIAYSVTLPASLATGTLAIYMDNEAIADPATSGTISLTNLDELTTYSHVLKAVVTLNDVTYTSSEVTVSFKTKSSTITDKVYKGYCPAAFTNAYLVGESESDRRNIYLNLPFTVTYDENSELTYEIDLTQCKDVVGMVPQLYCDGWFTLTAGDNNKWYCNVGTKTEGGSTNIAHYIPYNGGVININFSNKYPTYGYEGDLTTIGTTTTIANFTAAGDIIQTQISPCEISVGAYTPALISIVGTDSNGYYTSDEYSLNLPDGVMFNEGALSVNQHGDFTVTATMGSATSTMIIHCQRNAESKNLISGMVGTSEDAENPANATDSDSGSFLFWNCTSTVNHSIVYNFGGNYYIESVEMLFETARAKDYAITLYNATDVANGAHMKAEAETNVITVEGNTNNLNVLRNTKAQEGTYAAMKLETSAANNDTWGIKIMDLKVYGSESTPTGVQNVAVDNNDADAPVEYFNLQGIRVANPAAGQILIRRQGQNATKIRY